MESSSKWMALAVIGVLAVYSSLFLLSSGPTQPSVQGGIATQLTYMVKGSTGTNYLPLAIGLLGLLCLLLSGYYYRKK